MPEPLKATDVTINMPEIVPVGKLLKLTLKFDGAYTPPSPLPAGLHWEYPDQDGCTFEEKSSTELILCAEKPGTYYAGIGTAVQKTKWDKLLAGGGIPAPTPCPAPNLSWVKNLIPSFSSVKHMAGGAIIALFLAWAAYHYINKPVPGPVEPVLTPLQKTLKAALDQDTDPDKIDKASKYADLMLVIVSKAKASPKVTTAEEFVLLGKESAKIHIGENAIPKTRAAVGGYVSSVLPREDSTPTDKAYWDVAEPTYQKVGQALKGLVTTK